MVEKTRDIKVKANLQSPFYVRKIDTKCPKGHCLLVKKDKENTYQKYHDKASKDKKNAKSHNFSFTN